MIYDFCVVGGGISGIAIAEILSRKEKCNICVLEKNSKLMSESSADQHGWFHLGSLYSFLENPSYLKNLIKNIKILNKYYKNFDRFNLFVDKFGKINFKNIEDSWFSGSTVNYYVASRNNPDLFSKNLFKKLINIVDWEIKIKKFISRHNKINDYNILFDNSEEILSKTNFINYNKKKILKPTSDQINIDTDTFFLMEGLDKPMRSKKIFSDLLSSFLFNKGEYFLNTKVLKVDNKNNYNEIILENKKIIKSKNVIFSCGYGLSEFTDQISVVESPLLTVYPSVFDGNLVKLTPNNDNTINHFNHEINGEFYSVIGSGLSCGLHDKNEKKRIEQKLIEISKKFFLNFNINKFHKVYFGKKVEFKSSENRNYSYKIFKLSGKNNIATIPGKFSMAFSLAVDVYKYFYNEDPTNNLKKFKYIDYKNVSANKHYNIVENYLSSL